MQDPLAFVLAVAHIAAVLALFNGFLTTIGQSRIATAAVESMARQPEAAGDIRTAMIIGCGFAETGGVYGFAIAALLIFVNPLVNNNIEHLIRVIGG